ncbi:unnamed protein product [Callosobruchus maculatus]|uniref:THAP-type domain-containing protein n=2 Tax=Callosobruchus maculatus TaxID=64391 RepID=A0A653D8J4_CALMS|nr:unnamed protein product [Callosobruchus maculatus]
MNNEPVAKRLKMSVLKEADDELDKENLSTFQSDNLNVASSTSDSATVTASPTSSTSTASVCEDMTVAKDSSVSERLQSQLASSPSNLATINVSPGSTTATASEGPEAAPEITELEKASHDSETSTTGTASETEEIIVKMAEETLEGDISDIGGRSSFRGKLALLDPRGTKQAKFKVKTQKNKIKSLQQSVRRLRKKANDLQSVIDVLKKKALITENAETAMKASLSGPAGEVFNRLLKGPGKQKYTPALRSFALTLHFYSPKAYSFVRKFFNSSLPHPVTISKWYRTIDGSPGWNEVALKTLKIKVQESPEKKILCNLVFDEMSIRKQIEWDGRKFHGYVDLGTNINSDLLLEAKEVLCFMLVCINGSWKIPVGYFLLDGLGATAKAALLTNCLTFLHESGVVVTSITFDGTPTNFSMVSLLGAQFSDPATIKPFFYHPITAAKVYIFLDACHMVKLVRNCFGSLQNFEDADNKQVSWSYINALVNLQYEEQLHLATKIKMRHLQWAKEKMKVRLARQTLSKSVSDALYYLAVDLKHHTFIHAEPTANFVKLFNDLFDIFNSKNRLAKYRYKRPLSQYNKVETFLYLEKIRSYILNLKVGGELVTKCPRKTGFLGFLISIESLKGIYHEYVEENQYLKYILTYKLSQDHIELFFGAIRSRGGHNNNPSAKQFEAAFKKLIVRSQIRAGDTGNVLNLDATSILFCSSVSITKNDSGDDLENTSESLEYENKIKEDMMSSEYLSTPSWDLTDYTKDVVGYISGFVVKQVKKLIACSKCVSLIETDHSLSVLQVRKEYSQLTKASSIVIEICKAGERYFRFLHKTINIFNKKLCNVLTLLITNTICNLPVEVYDGFGDHLYDEDPLTGHATTLFKLLLKKYFTLRIHYECMKKLDANTMRVRSSLTKTILFKNQ